MISNLYTQHLCWLLLSHILRQYLNDHLIITIAQIYLKNIKSAYPSAFILFDQPLKTSYKPFQTRGRDSQVFKG